MTYHWEITDGDSPVCTSAYVGVIRRSANWITYTRNGTVPSPNEVVELLYTGNCAVDLQLGNSTKVLYHKPLNSYINIDFTMSQSHQSTTLNQLVPKHEVVIFDPFVPVFDI